jgi:hypothetical protein
MCLLEDADSLATSSGLINAFGCRSIWTLESPLCPCVSTAMLHRAKGLHKGRYCYSDTELLLDASTQGSSLVYYNFPRQNYALTNHPAVLYHNQIPALIPTLYTGPCHLAVAPHILLPPESLGRL